MLKKTNATAKSEMKKFVLLVNTGDLSGIKIAKSVNFDCSPVATSNNILYAINMGIGW